MTKPFFRPYHYDRPRRPRIAGGVFLILALMAAGSWYYFVYHPAPWPTALKTPSAMPTSAAPVEPQAGQLLGIEARQVYDATQAQAMARENYGTVTLPALTGATKITFRYRSTDRDGSFINVYGRAYIPLTGDNHQVFAFAPGTTGMGDQCAPSLENVKVSNWGNYDSHMLMYASQGFAVVTTDYEGMRDTTRIHHYMVGELEGRALLDAIRALRMLPEAQHRLDAEHVVVGGYSQGGHAAYWADTIAPTYAPDVVVKGVVGFGPVMSVKESVGDVAYGSSLNWFGPYVLASYTDYYKQDYQLARIFQPRYLQNLRHDVLSHCIDTDIAYWGHNPSAVYTPEFLAAINSETFAASYPLLAEAMSRNAAGNEPTESAKLINQGRFDNVILARQQQAMIPGMCVSSRGAVALKTYDGTHYNTMVLSLRDTIAWMKQIGRGEPPATTCQPPV